MIRRIQAVINYQLGKRHERAGDDARAASLYARALQLNGRRGKVLARLAFAEAQLAHYQRAEAAYLDAIDLLGSRGKATSDVAFLELGLAAVYQNVGRTSEAIGLIEVALLSLERTKGSNDRSIANALLNLGNCLAAEGRYEEAQAILERALAATKPDPESTAKALSSIGSLLKAQERFAEAEQALNKALSTAEGLENGDNARAGVLADLASVCARQLRQDEAAEYYRQALTILESLRGPEHPVLTPILNNLAIVEARLDNYDQAAKYYRRAIVIEEQAFGPKHPEIASMLNNLAALYLKEGRIDDAETGGPQIALTG